MPHSANYSHNENQVAFQNSWSNPTIVFQCIEIALEYQLGFDFFLMA